MAKMRQAPIRHPVTGCRADTVLGVWLYHEWELEVLVSAVMAIVEGGQLEQCAERSREMQEDWRPYTVSKGIAQITMSGPLTKHPTSMSSMFGGTAMTQVRESLRMAREDTDVRGVFVNADSWGGTAEGTAELAEAIRKTDSVKPLFVHAEDKATSGMLWIASQGRRFTASPGASVGSQGTMLQLVDTSGALKGSGIKPVIIKTGEFKAMGARGVPITDAQQAEFQRYVNAVNKPFHDQVVSARRLTPSQDKDVSTARVYVGEDALRIGLIDQVCHADEAFENALRMLDTGTASRGPAPVVSVPAVPKGKGGRMALTAQQIERVRAQVPGAASIKEDELDAFLADRTLENEATIKSAAKTAKDLQAEVSAKDTEIATLKSKITPKADAEVLKGRVDNYADRVQIAVEKGEILASQAELINSWMQDKDGKPTAFAEGFMAVQAGVSPAALVLNLIKLNKPSGLTIVQSGSQPAPKQEPGKPEGEPKATYERYCEIASNNGLQPVPRAEWESRPR